MTSIQEIISKQKEQEEKARDNELNEIKKQIDKIKRENQEQTKNSNTEKESNIETIKKVARKGYPEANVRFKNSKPESRNKSTLSFSNVFPVSYSFCSCIFRYLIC